MAKSITKLNKLARVQASKVYQKLEKKHPQRYQTKSTTLVQAPEQESLHLIVIQSPQVQFPPPVSQVQEQCDQVLVSPLQEFEDRQERHQELELLVHEYLEIEEQRNAAETTESAKLESGQFVPYSPSFTDEHNQKIAEGDEFIIVENNGWFDVSKIFTKFYK